MRPGHGAKTQLWLVIAAGCAAIFFSGCAPRAEAVPTAKTHQVRIHGMAFEPAVLEIQPGDRVTWTNADIVPHGVQSADPARPFRSQDLQPGQSWTAAPAQIGPYICPFHPTMSGRITAATH